MTNPRGKKKKQRKPGAKTHSLPKLITEPHQLKRLCAHLRQAPRIALDTEFVPEHTYYPELCLVQVATDEIEAVVDAIAIQDLSPLWDALCRKSCEVVVHAGRAELDFCLQYAGRFPGRVVDVQMLAGFQGTSYPVSYSKLLRETLDIRVEPSQARTDWRKRPLNNAQINYALEDVRHLLEARDLLVKRCKKLRRWDWYTEEIQVWQEKILDKANNPEAWRGTSGAGSIKGRELAALRELYQWRENRAARANKPRKRILSDEQLVDLAKSLPRSRKDLEKSRRIVHLGRVRWIEEVFTIVQRVLSLPDSKIPKWRPRPTIPKDAFLIKILAAVVGQIADERMIATSLLATKDDVKKLIDWHNEGSNPRKKPRLMVGWRERICGRPLHEILQGRLLLGLDHSPMGNTRVFFSPAPDPQEQ